MEFEIELARVEGVEEGVVFDRQEVVRVVVGQVLVVVAGEEEEVEAVVVALLAVEGEVDFADVAEEAVDFVGLLFGERHEPHRMHVASGPWLGLVPGSDLGVVVPCQQVDVC